MTDVWRTRGPRYHSRADCQGIIDGQAKAASEGKPTYRPELVPLTSLQLEGVTPCMRCWPEEPGWYEWLRLELKTENHAGAKDGSPYELHFFHNVLQRLPALKPEHIRVQYEVETRDGFRFPDFVLDIPGHQPIALEVDGQDKTTSPRPDERERSLQRDAALHEAGYLVQHFTNRQVATDPGWCVRQVERLITDSRREPSPITPRPLSQRGAEAEEAENRSWIRWPIAAACILAAVVIAVAITRFALEGSDLTGTCDSNHPVKGSVSQSGEKIYHEPGWTYYDRTDAEECFETAEDAERSGYRASQVK